MNVSRQEVSINDIAGPVFWDCNVCGALNHEIDGECQYCDCECPQCQRGNCSDPRHFPEETGQ
jgi:hypothetical protein